jgi:hypothetical protein
MGRPPSTKYNYITDQLLTNKTAVVTYAEVGCRDYATARTRAYNLARQRCMKVTTAKIDNYSLRVTVVGKAIPSYITQKAKSEASAVYFCNPTHATIIRGCACASCQGTDTWIECPISDSVIRSVYEAERRRIAFSTQTKESE